ncbi:unnamed protein product [Onchocerca flexuosa]|uniref:G_PROTEIN_RECEP_F1_2 domain-containing protein n=1 Tax=Onchocerca flexuosa TaxID=387005 RepID=A0A183H9X6_9BILA|nr:unnamed protein product [Onchocerca flexuosa]
MMNGQIRQAMLVDDQDLDGTTVDTLPKSMQFNESSENYRCFCNCFHIKSGALIVAGTELLMLIIFLINSLVIIVEHDIKDDKVAGTCDSYVIKSFAASMVCIALSFLAVLLLFAGIIRNTATFLIPHLIVQNPGTSTVALDARTTARFVIIFILYFICLILQCWFVMIIHNCYHYLKERSRYMHYCLKFSTPMKTLIFR